MVYGSDSSWNVNVEMDFSSRVDNSQRINSSPQLSHLPVPHVRYGQTTTITLPITDPDGDTVRCRWAANNAEGGGVYGFYSSMGLTLSVSYSLNGYS